MAPVGDIGGTPLDPFLLSDRPVAPNAGGCMSAQCCLERLMEKDL